MVRTVPFHGINTGSIPVRDIFSMNFKTFTNPEFLKHWNQLKVKTYYNVYIMFLTFVISFENIDLILNFFAGCILDKIETPKIGVYNSFEILWFHLQVAAFATVAWCVPFIITNYFFFFLNGLYEHEYRFYLKFYVFFILLNIWIFLIIHAHLIPALIDLTVLFEGSNPYIPTYVEISFDKFFFDYMEMVSDGFILLNFPYVLYILLNVYEYRIPSKFQNRPTVWLMLLMLSLWWSPADVFMQIWVFIFLIHAYELWLTFYYALTTDKKNKKDNNDKKEG